MQAPEQRWRVYRVTFDTNIFVRAVIQTDSLAQVLISLWHEKKFVLVLPQEIVHEIQDVLSRPTLTRKYQYSQERATNLISRIYQEAVIVEVPYSFGLCRDVNDNPLIDCAIRQ